MIPQIDSRFNHIPLDAIPKAKSGPSSFKKMPSFPIHTATDERQESIESACRHATSPFISVAYSFRRKLDRNAPVSNAFVKMLEMCSEPEVNSIIVEKAEHGKKLNLICLAEAPGTFPIAIIYYIANRYPLFLSLDNFEYRCTTLPYGDDKVESLGDAYTLIDANMDKWFFMDHTSPDDTRSMVKTFAASFGASEKEGSAHLVTGDIGKPITNKNKIEDEMFKEELGQLVAACAVLKDGGTAVLKMFSVSTPGTGAMLRLAIGVFDTTRIFKPRTSHQVNQETYWIMGGFKRSLFQPLYEPLLDVMADGRPFAFLPIEEDLIKRMRSLKIGTQMRIQPLLRKSLECIALNKGDDADPFQVQIKMIKINETLFAEYIEEWKQRHPISPLGELFYKLTGISPSSTSRSAKTSVYSVGVDDEDAAEKKSLMVDT